MNSPVSVVKRPRWRWAASHSRKAPPYTIEASPLRNLTASLLRWWASMKRQLNETRRIEADSFSAKIGQFMTAMMATWKMVRLHKLKSSLRTPNTSLPWFYPIDQWVKTIYKFSTPWVCEIEMPMRMYGKAKIIINPAAKASCNQTKQHSWVATSLLNHHLGNHAWPVPWLIYADTSQNCHPKFQIMAIVRYMAYPSKKYVLTGHCLSNCLCKITWDRTG